MHTALRVIKMTEEELFKKAATFLQENYGVSLHIPIKRNNRLRSTLGRFVLSSNNQPLRIELAGNTLDYGTEDAIIGILKHECIHYVFHMKGESGSDGHPSFEAELKKHDAPSTKTSKIGKYYIFTCNACGKKSETRLKRLKRFPHKYRTGCCSSKLTVIGERIYDGME